MKFNLLFAVLFCLPVAASASTIEVHEHQLENGLKVLVKEDHRSPVVVSQVWYKVGSSYESGGITGISHMLEHMMFKGTEKYPDGEFSSIIAANGGRENAFTGRDYTTYFQTMDQSRLAVSFELEADRMRNLRLSSTELKKELEVVMEERRMRTEDKPRAKLQEYFMALAFTNSPYKNPIIGWPSDIAHYTVDDLQKWYRQWYAPNNATLVVVGDVKFEAVFALAEQYFAAIKPSEIAVLKPQVEIEQRGIRRTTVKLAAKLPYILMGYKVPVLNTISDETDAYALTVLAAILDGGNSARFATNLVRGKQIVVAAAAEYNLATRLDSLFLLDATPAEGKTVVEVENALLQEVRQLRETLIADEELQRVKTQVLANSVYQRDSNFYQGMQLGMLETIGQSWRKEAEYVAKISQITAEQVRAAARNYLLPDKLTIAYLEPQTQPEQKRQNNEQETTHAE